MKQSTKDEIKLHVACPKVSRQSFIDDEMDRREPADGDWGESFDCENYSNLWSTELDAIDCV